LRRFRRSDLLKSSHEKEDPRSDKLHITGVGRVAIPAGDQNRSLEFYVARSSGGAGLGLAISQGLVHAHGGRIWAENRGGGGTRVAFTLPLATGGSLSRASQRA